MSIEIEIQLADPRSAEGTRLLRASHTLMQSLFPADACHILSVNDLCAAHVRFFIARHGETAAGCAALANMGDYGEVKSMFVDATARGAGLGWALLDHIKDEARAAGTLALKLETATKLTRAVALYQRAGFTECGPFSGYKAHSASLFMQCNL